MNLTTKKRCIFHKINFILDMTRTIIPEVEVLVLITIVHLAEEEVVIFITEIHLITEITTKTNNIDVWMVNYSHNIPSNSNVNRYLANKRERGKAEPQLWLPMPIVGR